MKIVFLIFLISISLNSFSQSSLSNTYNTDNYTIKYPANWTIDTSKLMGSTFFLYAPVADSADDLKANFNLVTQDLPSQDFGLEDYKKLTEMQMYKVFEKEDIYESKIITENGISYYSMHYAGAIFGKKKLKFKAICFIKDKKAYLLTFTVNFSKYDYYKETVNEVLKSFIIK